MPRYTSTIRKNEIVQSARELIINKGIKAVTIKNIAAKNKITEGAIYRHFKSKRAILQMLVEDFESNLMKAIDCAIRDGDDPIETLKNIMIVHLKYTEERKSELFVITAASVHFDDRELRQNILDVIERYKSRIKIILLKAQKENLLRNKIDLDSVSLTFFGLIQITAIQYALTNYTVAPITKFNTLWEIFIKGIVRLS
ncbi:MAG: TetR/AcrR family transcriptional regulator [Endomicrobiales bacterium]|jgi:AcrR family transcriptional regulator